MTPSRVLREHRAARPAGHAQDQPGRVLTDGKGEPLTNSQPLAVHLQGLTKRYGELTAVRDLSMAIESGEIVV